MNYAIKQLTKYIKTMPKNKKLEKLQEIVDNISETQNIDPDDPETWDSDTLYNLVEDLKEALKLLEDKKSQTEKDNFGEPLILEAGICSLVDTYNSEEEEI